MENFPWRVTVNYSRNNSRRSFTLIELLMVISIISLLIALLLPALQRAKRQVRLIMCASNQNQIGIELMSYVIDWGQYPPPGHVSMYIVWESGSPLGQPPESGALQGGHWHQTNAENPRNSDCNLLRQIQQSAE